jgi:Domain of unknown function (DUF4157)/Ubiquitin carboxyl-terminal hydrolase
VNRQRVAAGNDIAAESAATPRAGTPKSADLDQAGAYDRAAIGAFQGFGAAGGDDPRGLGDFRGTGGGPAAHVLLGLQRTHGNRFVQRLLEEPAPTLQFKLRLGPIDDRHEREADRLAEQIAYSGDDHQAAERHDIGRVDIGRVADTASGAVDPAVQQLLLGGRGRGHPLSASVRQRYERYLGADLAAVRLHTDHRADDLNLRLRSDALTNGHDIYFRRGEYDLASSAGRELLAHELVHVVQQTAAAADAASPLVQRARTKQKNPRKATQPKRGVNKPEAKPGSAPKTKKTKTAPTTPRETQPDQEPPSRGTKRKLSTPGTPAPKRLRPDGEAPEEIPVRYLSPKGMVTYLQERGLEVGDDPKPVSVGVVVWNINHLKGGDDDVDDAVVIPDAMDDEAESAVEAITTALRDLIDGIVGVESDLTEAAKDLIAEFDARENKTAAASAARSEVSQFRRDIEELQRVNEEVIKSGFAAMTEQASDDAASDIGVLADRLEHIRSLFRVWKRLVRLRTFLTGETKAAEKVASRASIRKVLKDYKQDGDQDLIETISDAINAVLKLLPVARLEKSASAAKRGAVLDLATDTFFQNPAVNLVLINEMNLGITHLEDVATGRGFGVSKGPIMLAKGEKLEKGATRKSRVAGKHNVVGKQYEYYPAVHRTEGERQLASLGTFYVSTSGQFAVQEGKENEAIGWDKANKTFRGIVVHRFASADQEFWAGVLHTTPAGKDLDRTKIWPQIEKPLAALNMVASHFKIPLLVGGDFYIPPEGIVNVPTDAQESEIKGADVGLLGWTKFWNRARSIFLATAASGKREDVEALVENVTIADENGRPLVPVTKPVVTQTTPRSPLKRSLTETGVSTPGKKQALMPGAAQKKPGAAQKKPGAAQKTPTAVPKTTPVQKTPTAVPKTTPVQKRPDVKMDLVKSQPQKAIAQKRPGATPAQVTATKSGPDVSRPQKSVAKTVPSLSQSQKATVKPQPNKVQPQRLLVQSTPGGKMPRRPAAPVKEKVPARPKASKPDYAGLRESGITDLGELWDEYSQAVIQQLKAGLPAVMRDARGTRKSPHLPDGLKFMVKGVESTFGWQSTLAAGNIMERDIYRNYRRPLNSKRQSPEPLLTMQLALGALGYRVVEAGSPTNPKQHGRGENKMQLADMFIVNHYWKTARSGIVTPEKGQIKPIDDTVLKATETYWKVSDHSPVLMLGSTEEYSAWPYAAFSMPETAAEQSVELNRTAWTRLRARLEGLKMSALDWDLPDGYSVESEIDAIIRLLSEPLVGPTGLVADIRKRARSLAAAIKRGNDKLTPDQEEALKELRQWDHPYYVTDFGEELLTESAEAADEMKVESLPASPGEAPQAGGQLAGGQQGGGNQAEQPAWLGQIAHTTNSCYLAALVHVFASNDAFRNLLDPQAHGLQTRNLKGLDFQANSGLRHLADRLRNPADTISAADMATFMSYLNRLEGMLVPLDSAARQPPPKSTGKTTPQPAKTTQPATVTVQPASKAPQQAAKNAQQATKVAQQATRAGKAYGIQQDASEILSKVLDLLEPADLMIPLESRLTSLKEGDQTPSLTYDPPSPMLQLKLGGDGDGVNSVEDALRHFSAAEFVEAGDDLSLHAKQLLFNDLPTVLTIALSRFVFTDYGEPKKITRMIAATDPLVFPDECMSETLKKKVGANQVIYRLVHVVHHSGKTARSGHYTSYGKLPDDTWYRHNDIGPNRRRLITDPAALQKELGTGYIYVYVKDPLAGMNVD